MSNPKHLTAWYNQDTDETHTPKARMVYPNLLEPRAMKGDTTAKPKYSVSLLLPKASNIDAVKKLVVEKAEAEFGKQWQTKRLRLPLLKTADFEKLADYAEAFPIFIRASANPDFPPFIFGPDAKQFSGDASDIYSGRWAVASVRAYAYDTAGNKGVALGLQRIQLLDHDEAIAGGRVATASGFEAVDVGSPSEAFTTDDVFGLNDKAAKRNKLDDEIPF